MNRPSSGNSGPMPTSCRGCGGRLRERFEGVIDPQTHESFGITECTECGLGQTFPVPKDLAPYYGPAYHGGRHGFTERYCMSRRARMLRQVVGAGLGRRLLDIGCGDGTFLVAARDGGWIVSGTEMNPAVARASGLEVWSDLDHASAQAPYACITAWHSLEHMRDPREVLEHAVGLLAPGGTVIVAVPDAQGLQARLYGARWFHLDVPRHLFHFGPASLSRMFESAGLEVMRSFHLEVEIDLFGWVQSALNSVSDEPNVFFHQLTGRPSRAGAGFKALNFAAGILLTPLAVPLTVAGAVSKRGATLVMAGRKS